MEIGEKLSVEAFFDPQTSTISYLVIDRSTLQAALIDSVLDYNPKSGRTSTQSADKLIDRVRELGVSVQWILETHVHADHVSAAAYLKEQLGGTVAIGSHITRVQKVFGTLFNAKGDFEQEKAAYTEAAKYLQSAVRQLSGAPDAEIIYQLLGLIYEKTENPAQAIKIYEEFLRIFPNSTEAEAVRSFIVQLKKQMNGQ